MSDSAVFVICVAVIFAFVIVANHRENMAELRRRDRENRS